MAEKVSNFGSWLWDVLVRWRTYIVNILFVAILTPELLSVLVNFNWGTIVPKEYVPYILLAQAVINVWMRPRPAARARDFADDERRPRK